MIINATAELYYNEGKAISSSSESLVLIVSFKNKGRLFKTKLYKDLCTIDDFYNLHGKYMNLNDYFEDVKRVLKNDKYIKECAIGMIERHFKGDTREIEYENNKREVVNMTKNKPKIEIKVEIK